MGVDLGNLTRSSGDDGYSAEEETHGGISVGFQRGVEDYPTVAIRYTRAATVRFVWYDTEHEENHYDSPIVDAKYDLDDDEYEELKDRLDDAFDCEIGEWASLAMVALDRETLEEEIEEVKS